ncbi:MAG: ion channel [Robiginitomaculum sp.]
MAHEHSFAERLKVNLYTLYQGQGPMAVRFSYWMLAFDIITILFFIITSALSELRWFIIVDVFIGVVVFLDFLARLWLARRKIRYLTRMTTIADVIVIVTLLLPAFLDNFIFLRVLRALRLLRSYHVLKDLRKRFKFFGQREEVVVNILNLLVFLFIITAFVYVLQKDINPGINNYIDALYFTVATLTTTGFGDVTLQGQSGHLLAVVMMVVGITLFLRLVQSIFKPAKVKYKCQTCGLNRHDMDAVHCKHCGETLAIETGGA